MAETFDVSPEFEYVRSSRRRAAQTPRSEGFVMRRQLWNTELRGWRLEWRTANDAVVARLRQLWSKTFGSTLSMDYTPQGEAQISARFVDDSLAISRLSAVHYAASVDLEEVR